MANIEYDTLTIQINADSKVATKNINALGRGLAKLDQQAKEIDKAKIEEVKTLLLDIANIDFSNVSKGLQDVVSAFKYFQQNRSNKNNNGIFGIGSPQAYAKELKSYARLSKNVDYGASLGNNEATNIEVSKKVNEVESLTKALKELGLTTKQTNAVFNALGTSINQLSFSEEQFKAIAEVLKKTGKSAEEVNKVIEKLREEIKELDEGVGSTGRSFGKMFVNIMKYRVVRRLIQNIFQEMQTAFQDLALLDPSFNEAMTTLSSSLSFIARSLVSIVAPIVKAIAPIVELIAQSVNEVANMLGGALASSLGQTFYEATERVDDYAESVKKAKSTTMGFDKLNIISKDNNSGFAEGQQINTTGKLAETFASITASIKTLIEQLTPQISMIAYSIVRALEKASPLLIDITDLFVELISLTDDSVNISVDMFIEAVGSLLRSTANLVKTLKPFLVFLTLALADIINKINWILTAIFSFIDVIANVFGTIHMGINGIISGDFTALRTAFIELVNDLTRNAINIIYALINPIISIVVNTINTFIGYVNRVIKSVNTALEKVGLDKYKMSEIEQVDFSGISTTQYNPTYTQTFSTSDIASQIAGQVNRNNKSGGGSGGDIVIQIDGREVARAVNKANANSGDRLLYGGNLNYGE